MRAVLVTCASRYYIDNVNLICMYILEYVYVRAVLVTCSSRYYFGVLLYR